MACCPVLVGCPAEVSLLLAAPPLVLAAAPNLPPHSCWASGGFEGWSPLGRFLSSWAKRRGQPSCRARAAPQLGTPARMEDIFIPRRAGVRSSLSSPQAHLLPAPHSLAEAPGTSGGTRQGWVNANMRSDPRLLPVTFPEEGVCPTRMREVEASQGGPQMPWGQRVPLPPSIPWWDEVGTPFTQPQTWSPATGSPQPRGAALAAGQRPAWLGPA